jgi:transposase InsO family protein
MHGMEKSLEELHGLLKTAETDMKKGVPHVLAVQKKGKRFKRTKNKRKDSGKRKTQVVTSRKPKPNGQADAECFYCKGKGHWKRNCRKYLEDKKNGNVPSSSGIHVIEINVTSSFSNWILDTGSCAHICRNVQALKNRRTLKKGEVQLYVGNGASVAAVAVGSVDLHLPSGLVLELNNVYSVPSISKNIISASCLDMSDFSIVIKNNSCSIYKNGLFYGSCNLIDGLYVLDLERQVLNINNKRIKTCQESMTQIWHHRLGHINERRMHMMREAGLLGQFDFESVDTCESCLLGKMTKAPFSKKGERVSDLLGLVHTDVCGPMSTTARGGFSYFITFTDDFSRFGYVYLMRHKSESLEKFKEFKNEVENQLDKRIKILRSDRGGEYLSNDCEAYLKGCGIVPQRTPPGTPQWNGVSERRNRTLLDMIRSMMSQTSLPTSFWGYALETAAFTLNRVPSKSIDKTPYEMWFGRVPNVSFLKIWGCETYVKRLRSDKLGPKSDKCMFIGYPRETKGYYFYYPFDNKIVVARHGVFLEKEFLATRSNGNDIRLEEVQEMSQHSFDEVPSTDVVVSGRWIEHEPQPVVARGFEPTSQPVVDRIVELGPPEVVDRVRESDPDSEPISQEVVNEVNRSPEHVLRRSSRLNPVPLLRRSSRTVRAPERYTPVRWINLVEESVLDTDDLMTYEKVMDSPDSDKWLEAMKSEMQSMYEHQVWNLVDLPDGIKPIQNKWVFKRKLDMDGKVSTYKARLVAKGFKQIHGIDYDETFAPVVMFKTIRILLAIAAFHGYEI